MQTQYVLAAELGGNSLSLAVVSRAGTIAARFSEARSADSPAAVLEHLARAARQLAKKHSVRSIAVAVAGSVCDGEVAIPEIAAGNSFPLERQLLRKFRMPVAVTSDRAAALMGESWKGAARDSRNALVLLLGETIRAGIRVEGRILDGAHGLAGSAGWMAVSEADGFEVRKFGGLEAFASAPGIVRAAKNAIEAGFGGSLADYDPSLFTAEDIAELARRGDVTARQIYRRAGKQLGLALSNLVSLFDPEIVVVSGSMTAASDLFWPDLLETATLRLPPGIGSQVRICLSEMQGDAVLLGAARAAWDLVPAPPRAPRRSLARRKSRARAR